MTGSCMEITVIHVPYLLIKLSFESLLTKMFHLPLFSGFKCPVCSKFILPDDIECHIVMCLTKPRLSYNGKSLISIEMQIPYSLIIHEILQRMY